MKYCQIGFKRAALLCAYVLFVQCTHAQQISSGRLVGQRFMSASVQYQALTQKIQMSERAFKKQSSQALKNHRFSFSAASAAGLGIAGFLTHMGWTDELAVIVEFILALIFFVIVITFFLRKWRQSRMPQTGYHPAYRYSGIGHETMSAPPPSQFGGEYAISKPSVLSLQPTTTSALTIPAGFDIEKFVYHAKLSFTHIQMAFDEGNLEDLYKLTTPEMFTQLRLEIQERKSPQQHTDIISLDAELLGIEMHSQEHAASVRFRGTLKEGTVQAASPIDEVWNFTRPTNSSEEWVLAGIQQLA